MNENLILLKDLLEPQRIKIHNFNIKQKVCILINQMIQLINKIIRYSTMKMNPQNMKT